MGSTNISSNIAIQQTQKNDFKLTVGESNKPITTSAQSNNIFLKPNTANTAITANTANKAPTNILSNQQSPMVSSSIPPGLAGTAQNQLSQNAGKSALALINKIH